MPIGFPPLRESALVAAELHQRPFQAYAAPRRFLHFVFVFDRKKLAETSEGFRQLCSRLAIAPPAGGARFHFATVGDWQLRWELHTEFATYTWSKPAPAPPDFSPVADTLPAAFRESEPPGGLLMALDLLLTSGEGHDGLAMFDRASLCVINAAQRAATVATDFVMREGALRMLVVDRIGMSPTRAGRLVQRLLEFETYRCMALLGLPLARRSDPAINAVESELEQLTRDMASMRGSAANPRLLGRLTELSAELEADIAASAFRFGATRAYGELVAARLEEIREEEHESYMSFSRFLRRRFNPATATVAALAGRQHALSERLGHAVSLLRTRIQSDLEEQNGLLLASMNRRSRLQLRLQQTVEGLSVAAISYYVVGLVGYIAKGLKDAGALPAAISTEIVAAASVPVVIVAIWAMLRRARRRWQSDH